ncbi:collagenase [Tahibacter amnicola]|uniref:microbial collagenase n=1 Tax=Tahibacter amnicola TaxID=2976241 RepID=A0ABY6BGI0_9GAMM|nr:collagenase [Tahibacter amnicola]UXI68617.1 collagenase [Tahibacter amnicola]
MQGHNKGSGARRTGSVWCWAIAGLLAAPLATTAATNARQGYREEATPHVQVGTITPDRFVPHTQSFDVHIDYDLPPPAVERSSLACDIAPFTTASGTALVDLVKASDVTGCIYSLFDLTGTTAGQVFNEAKMITVANALTEIAPAYPGNNTTKMWQLVMFLRAGFYVQYNNATAVGNYGPSLDQAVNAALDAFALTEHLDAINAENGTQLYELLVLVDSADLTGRQFNLFKRVLTDYSPAYHPQAKMVTAVNRVFTDLYYGQYKPGFQSDVESDPSIITALRAFIETNTANAGTTYEYLLVNATNEFGRFIRYPGVYTTVKEKLKSILDTYPMIGLGGGIWMAAAGMVDYYDGANCAYYGVCNFKQTVMAQLLTITHPCSPTLALRAQNLTASEIADTCAKVAGEETYFHQVMQTNNTPVADDQNTSLTMVVYDSSYYYKAYSGVLFGHSTNNGGIYMEGTPSSAGNRPHFYAYERAATANSPWEIWNLTHEYIHYLDGRFDMYGGFGSYPTSAPNSAVWYIEGVAEYFSYTYRQLTYAGAVTEALTQRLRFRDMPATIYNTDYNRIYGWGYLAVRFLMERHRGDIDSLLALFRQGNYASYPQWVSTIGGNYDVEFRQWLSCFAGHNGDTSQCTDLDKLFANGFENPTRH